MEEMDVKTAIEIVGEKVARELGIEGAEVELDYIEDGDLRLSLMKDGRNVGLVWVDPETGKIWGFTLDMNAPKASFQTQLKEFADLMQRIL